MPRLSRSSLTMSESEEASHWQLTETVGSWPRTIRTRVLSTASVVVFGSDQPFSRWQVHDAELLAVLSPKDFD